jgi:sugar/nucleoside kinase (ribokinase family)
MKDERLSSLRLSPSAFMSAPVHYLAIGHVAKDLTPQGPRLGGSAAFAALTARVLGYPPGIVTSSGDDLDLGPLNGAPLQRIPASDSTTFENLYGANGRTQFLRGRATPLTPEHVPTEWLRAPIVHIAPLARELTPEIVAAFSGAFIGLTPQGWLRQWDEAGRVSASAWPEALAVLPQTNAAVLSIEDVRGDWVLIENWSRAAPVLAVTEGVRGCTVFGREQGARQFAVTPQTEVDPTGAGDIFAAAFFIHLYETNDPWAAARVANHLAAISVTRVGLDGVPTPEDAGLARLKAELP